MPQPETILTTCGTSLLTNGADLETQRLLLDTANSRHGDLTVEQRALLDARLTHQGQVLAEAPYPRVRELSAELNALLTYYGGSISRNGASHHIILSTDTYQGEGCAHLIGAWLRARGHSAEVKPFRGLATQAVDEFREALGDIVTWAEECLVEYRNRGYRLIFNLNGGFKAIQGFMQTLGLFYSDEIIYLFQGSEQLLRIPRLPIRLDVGESVSQHRETLRRLFTYGSLEQAQCSGVPDLFLLVIDGQAHMSEWGQLVWVRNRKDLYQAELLPPLSDRVGVTPGFRKDCGKLPPDRLALVNERLDDLARCVDSAGAYNPDRLSFKKRENDNSWQAYAWSDRDAARMHCSYQNGNLVVERLEPHA